MKKIFMCIMLIIGTIIGAGFCSGKEIATYFARFGLSSLFFVPVLFLLYYFIFKLFLSLGAKQNFNSIYDINKIIFKKTFNISNILLFIIYFIFTSAMFAGIYEIGQNFSGEYVSFIFIIFSFIFAYLILQKSFALLIKINAILVPILIILIFIYTIYGIIQIPQSNYIIDIKMPFLMFFNPIIYACQGLALAYYILVKAGEGLSHKQIKLSAFISSLLLSVMQVLIIIVLNLKPELLSSEMPMLSLAFYLGFPFDWIYLLVLFFAILTTLFATSRSLTEIISLKVKNSKISSFLSLILGLILSVFGFGKIIEYLYPIIGIIGFCILVLLYYRSFFVNGLKFINSKIHNPSKDT